MQNKLTKILMSNIGEVPVDVVVILSKCDNLSVYERLFAGVEVMKHYYNKRLEEERGLSQCTVCGGGEAELTTDCPGRPLTETERSQIIHGELDYKNNKWLPLITPATHKCFDCNWIGRENELDPDKDSSLGVAYCPNCGSFDVGEIQLSKKEV